jgi:Tol biopolymer transport system component
MRLISVFLFGLVLTGYAHGQDFGDGFGKNKVQYDTFDWRFIQSEHFDVYFAPGAERIAEFCAETAEASLRKVENSFNYRLEGRVTIVTYRSHNGFEQTNVSSEIPEESVGGFTEFMKNRVVIPFTGNYESFRHVIHHELTHAVNMRMFYGTGFQSILTGVATSNVPLWFTEGLAEYESRGGWDVEADMFMRDATISGYLPPIDFLGGYLAYKGGQSVFYYMDRKYGPEKVSEFIGKVKSARDVNRALKSSVGVDMKEFNREWQNWLRSLYWPTIADLKRPGDFAERMTDHREWRNFVNNGSAISPDGTQIALLSDRTGFFDIWLMNIDNGHFTRLLQGERSEGFEQLKWLDARISWSPDGKFITFASKAGKTDAVNILDVKRHKISRTLRFDMDGVFNPTWSPDGNKIAFVGMKAGASDLYYYDLSSNSLAQVTHDVFSDDDPAWSPDSKSLVFSSDREDSLRTCRYDSTVKMWTLDYHHSHLYSMALGDSLAQRLTNTPYSERTPTYTADGKFLIYVSDANGIPNLYRRDLATGESVAVTNCLTGCTQPSYSARTQRMVFTSLQEGGYDVYLIKNAPELPGLTLKPTNFRQHGSPEPQNGQDSTAVAGLGGRTVTGSDSVTIPAGGKQGVAHHVFAERGTQDPERIGGHALGDTALTSTVNTTRRDGGGFFSKKYKTKFSPDFFYANAAYSSFLGAQGTGQLLLSDVMGNQLLYVTTDLYYDLKNLDNTNFSLQYLYLPHRINYGIGFYRYVYYLDAGNLKDQTIQLNLNASYPISKYSRADLDVNALAIDRSKFDDPANDYLFDHRRRAVVPSLSYIHDTVLWGSTGPVNGSRYRFSLSASPALGSNTPGNSYPYAQFYTVKGDVRDYFRLNKDFSLASRITAGLSGGPNPQSFYLGGVSNWLNTRYENSRVPDDIDAFYFSSFVTPYRGANYFEKAHTGNRFFLVNQELRFPLIEQMQMRYPLPVAFYDIRGAVFTDIGAAWQDDAFKLTAVGANGKRVLKDPQAAFGLGMRANLGMFILHWDLAWSTDGTSVSKPRYFFSLGSEY